ncbi:hypothetical protein PLICRDRAFT_46638 [Plicaturopsis crispa FD-325 SS-3]|uniref:Ras-domain-containing protein n=1 Tax=Plicaturopsis crispa FD-325 SS-3 TaxID=944288 RepID=A0A0C9SQK6_PLICR|nr:hypothetical protein PLICRDRAFT_46638 [Plicaturopsis crispa FD-325 SS-3]
MPTVKLVVIGPSGVGKTSLRGQYISGRFSTGYRATIGADFISKTLPHPTDPAQSVTLQIWDTAGQERFSSLSSAFFRGADAALLMYDVNRPQTLHALTKWWDEFRERAPVSDEEAETFCCVVVGNKIDIPGKDRISDEETRAFVDGLLPPSCTPSPPRPASPPLPPNGGVVHFDPDSSTTSLAINGRLSKSRSRSSSRFRGGTMTSTYSFHTASSSLFDVYASARSSPVGSYTSSIGRRSSADTITPSLYNGNANLSVTVSPALTNNSAHSRPVEDTRPAEPLKRPALFFASAKTGEGVADVFQYIARRVVRKWDWEDALENRTLHVQDVSVAEDRVRLGGDSLRDWKERGRSCCSS